MKLTFLLLDINYEVRNNVPELWLWGVDDSGKRVLIIDRNFVDYFYAVIEEGISAKKVVEEIAQEKDVSVAKLEIVERKFFGKPVKTIKVYCKNPNDITKIAKAFRNCEGIKDCFEDDIRYSMRDLIDNNAVPCGWHEIEVIEEKNALNVKADKIYTAKSSPKLIEKTETPQLRILGFSTICYSREGSPKPDRNPVIIISVTTNHGEQKQFLANGDKNDKPVLEEFINYVRNFDPDIIVGYGVNTQDWPYLSERCKKLGLRLNIDRAGTEPHTSVYGHVSLTGRINLDLYDFADEFPEVKVKTLENMANYLGVMKIEKRTLIDDVDFADYWDDKDNDYNKFIPLVSRRIRKRINPEGLINGYRAYLFPNQGATALFLMFYLAFSNSSNLEKFVSALKYLPFNIGYEKILGKDALFVRIIIPAYECSNLRKSLARLAEKGHLKDARLFFGDLNSGTWDNVEIYQMFKDETWNFSYGVAIEMLEKIL